MTGGSHRSRRAASCWKLEKDRVFVLLVHRPKYEDWSLPKGKLDPGESHEEAARREVEEETGYRCKLGHELQQIAYRDGRGRPKRVRYWEMTVSKGEFAVNDEVDKIEWLTIGDAVDRLSYEHRDVPVLASFKDLVKKEHLDRKR